ncbi:hypothetical protein NDU88_000810 [Pleurodeles waltl]|uniref:Uncharacterized protein n=1 Tax=Pleurodeles waltl TaxID=8319 RepID=A0AAV7TG21_PLEWA|nr:hypothetical protein NDU88_000810 [Pleurodeles waltl]
MELGRQRMGWRHEQTRWSELRRLVPGFAARPRSGEHGRLRQDAWSCRAPGARALRAPTPNRQRERSHVCWAGTRGGPGVLEACRETAGVRRCPWWGLGLPGGRACGEASPVSPAPEWRDGWPACWALWAETPERKAKGRGPPGAVVFGSGEDAVGLGGRLAVREARGSLCLE